MTTIRGFLQLQTCIKAEDLHCLEFEKMNHCLICEEGYFLDEFKVCRKIPEPSIRNCLKYDQNLNCLLCEKDYYLENSL